MSNNLSPELVRLTDSHVASAEPVCVDGGGADNTALARNRSKSASAAQGNSQNDLLHAVSALIVVLEGDGSIVSINRACQQVTGFTLDEVRGQPLWAAFSLPDEAEQFRMVFQTWRHNVDPLEYESPLLTKQSKERRIVWSCMAVPNADDEGLTFIVTGVDVTNYRDTKSLAVQADEDERSEVYKERRHEVRRAYPYMQYVAPVVGARLPYWSDFASVCCSDITSSGFSFLASGPPQSDRLVVALGDPPNLTHLLARVMHVTRLKDKDAYRVGCRYTSRVRY